jgi:amino-acid N-acetyltransferase
MTAPLWEIREATRSDWPSIESLLKKERLPTDDLTPSKSADFHVAVDSNTGEVVAAVAVEQLGATGLFRSLVVKNQYRSDGLGGQMTRTAMSSARRRGINELWLLTNDADGFFEKYGFVKRLREDAPDSVRKCREFAELCPASAILMSSRLVNICAPETRGE